MGKVKTVFKFYTIPEYRKEEEFLSSMHRQGWKFTKVTFLGFYHFEQCEPENVTYRQDYNQDGVAAGNICLTLSGRAISEKHPMKPI